MKVNELDLSYEMECASAAWQDSLPQLLKTFNKESLLDNIDEEQKKQMLEECAASLRSTYASDGLMGGFPLEQRREIRQHMGVNLDKKMATQHLFQALSKRS